MTGQTATVAEAVQRARDAVDRKWAGRELVGYFDRPATTEPAFDPGLDAPCLVCWERLLEQPRVTVSLMWHDGDRSLFFRAHKACWEGLTDVERQRYEESVLEPLARPVSE